MSSVTMMTAPRSSNAFPRINPTRSPSSTCPVSFAELDLSGQLDALRAAIEQLPPEQREVVLLRHESELTFREIAEITDVSINTALGRMRYALINLRKMMVPETGRESS